MNWQREDPLDQREAAPDEVGADVLQCRTQRADGSFTGDASAGTAPRVADAIPVVETR